jgi:hypothetical protein
MTYSISTYQTTTLIFILFLGALHSALILHIFLSNKKILHELKQSNKLKEFQTNFLLTMYYSIEKIDERTKIILQELKPISFFRNK